MRPWEEGTEPGALGRQGHPARNRRGANPRGRAADLASDHEVEPSGLRWARQPPASRSAAECLSETVGGACGPRHAGAEVRRGRGAAPRCCGLPEAPRPGRRGARGAGFRRGELALHSDGPGQDGPPAPARAPRARSPRPPAAVHRPPRGCPSTRGLYRGPAFSD